MKRAIMEKLEVALVDDSPVSCGELLNLLDETVELTVEFLKGGAKSAALLDQIDGSAALNAALGNNTPSNILGLEYLGPK